jgi:hypothetical protein
MSTHATKMKDMDQSILDVPIPQKLNINKLMKEKTMLYNGDNG